MTNINVIKKPCIACEGKGYVLQKPHGNRKLTLEQKKQILLLHREGYGLHEIARRVGVKHAASVRWVIVRANRDIEQMSQAMAEAEFGPGGYSEWFNNKSD